MTSPIHQPEDPIALKLVARRYAADGTVGLGRVRPVPRSGFVDALLAEASELMQDSNRDVNAVLTLARIWNNVATSDIRSKDDTADWALTRLAPDHHAVLQRARDLYVGVGQEDWEELEQAIPSFKTAIRAHILSAAEGGHP